MSEPKGGSTEPPKAPLDLPQVTYMFFYNSHGRQLQCNSLKILIKLIKFPYKSQMLPPKNKQTNKTWDFLFIICRHITLTRPSFTYLPTFHNLSAGQEMDDMPETWSPGNFWNSRLALKNAILRILMWRNHVWIKHIHVNFRSSSSCLLCLFPLVGTYSGV